MAIKVFHLQFLVFLVLLVISSIGQARRRNNDPPNNKTSSPFDYIMKLEGCRKGTNTKGIQHLKTYLHNFGYLQNLNETHANTTTNDHFDDSLESAIKTYQRNYHINPTGVLDATTVSRMTAPRCGVPDIINGTNHMEPRTMYTGSHYSFFGGRPVWPSSKTHLTYWFPRYTPRRAISAVESALQKWAAVSQFTFSRVGAQANADLTIKFQWRDHSDGYPFDGPGGVLAHAFAPTDGRLHLDGDERWSIGAVPDYIDLESVAIHEIGHLLGLGHSDVENAVMYPSIAAGVVRSDLDDDDIEGIWALYN